MDQEINTPVIRADDIGSDSSSTIDCDKDVKEKCELIFEVKTICNMGNIKVDYESSDKSYKHSINSNLLNTFTLSNPFSQDSSEHAHNYISESKLLDNTSEKNMNSCTANFCNSKLDDCSPKELKLEQSDKLPEFQVEKIEDSNSNESIEQSTGDSKRSRRNSKRKKEYDEYCPICGVTVRLQDLEFHYNQEVEKLSKLPRNAKKLNREEAVMNKTYLNVKKNRESRLTARVARYSARAKNEVKCPVCNLRMSGSAEEINKHVAFCIQDEDSEEMIDVDYVGDDGNESFEEYEFGDETRIRAISLVPGGYNSLLGNSTRIRTLEDENLHVDVDDTSTFGEPQYSEHDVIPDTPTEKDKAHLERLRKAVLRNSSVQRNVLESRKWCKIEMGATGNPDLQDSESNPIVASLREKIKDLEDHNKSVKCLICLEAYTKPVVSTACWHVHCEECWLMTMGVKKLCPQCNMIVFPADLRKIYL